MHNSVCSRENQFNVCEKNCVLSQNMFRRVVARAESRGMVVNNQKTKIVCVSDALSYEARSYLLHSSGEKLSSGGGGIKVLGFHMDSRPTCLAHVNALKAHMRETTWVLRHLKKSGFNEKELARVYVTIIRPILCLLYTSPSPRDRQKSRMPSSA